jgi:hypothetical protein
MSDWERIREHFTEAEKDTLNAAIDGETICPPGCTINEHKAGRVVTKIRRKLDELEHPEMYKGISDDDDVPLDPMARGKA